MFTDVILAIFIGLILGVITGIVPGIHVNLVALIAVSVSHILFLYFPPIVIAVAILSLAITHTFLNSIPGIYLGAPDAGTELNVLPGHRLLLRGHGHNAVLYTLIGSLFSLILSVLLFPVFSISMKSIYPIVRNYIGYALIAIMSYMILKEKGIRQKGYAFIMFLTAGILGLIVLSIPNLNQPLLHLLSGLFGVSILLISLFEKTMVPKQNLNAKMEISRKNLIKTTSASTGVGFVAAFLPGFGTSQAAIVAANLVGDVGDEGFLTLIGGINTANFLISLSTIYTLQRARNGPIIAINKLMGQISLESVFVFIAAALIAGGLATILAINISKILSHLIQKISYKKIVISVISFIAILSLYFDSIFGILILITTSCLGILATKLGVGRNHLMGCLILPVILFFVL